MPLSRNKLNFFVETRYNTMVQQRERMDSMSYVALYRTWRPQDFDGLVGQEHIRKALTNALESGRISHAYLFTGPRGTGKTSTARILAKALNCEKGQRPILAILAIIVGKLRKVPVPMSLKSMRPATAELMRSGSFGNRSILHLFPAVTRSILSTKCI